MRNLVLERDEATIMALIRILARLSSVGTANAALLTPRHMRRHMSRKALVAGVLSDLRGYPAKTQTPEGEY